MAASLTPFQGTTLTANSQRKNKTKSQYTYLKHATDPILPIPNYPSFHLTLINFSKLTPAELSKIIHKFKYQLRSIEIINCEQITRKILRSTLNQFSNLKKLKFYVLGSPNGSIEMRIVQKSNLKAEKFLTKIEEFKERLTYLDIRECPQINFDVLFAAVKKCSHLKRLTYTFDRESFYPSDWVQDLIHQIPTLQQLRLHSLQDNIELHKFFILPSKADL